MNRLNYQSRLAFGMSTLNRESATKALKDVGVVVSEKTLNRLSTLAAKNGIEGELTLKAIPRVSLRTDREILDTPHVIGGELTGIDHPIWTKLRHSVKIEPGIWNTQLFVSKDPIKQAEKTIKNISYALAEHKEGYAENVNGL